MRSDIILRIPKINKAKRSGPVTRGFEVVILSPVLAITDAVRIQGIRLKITEDSRMIMGIIDIAFKNGGHGLNGIRLHCSTIRAS